MAIPEVKSYTKTYDAFRGVDFSTDPTQVADARSPYAVNLVSDLAGFPEKRLGWRTLATLVDERINGLFYVVFTPEVDTFIVHADENLYKWTGDDNEPVLIGSGMADARSTGFAHKGRFFLLDGTTYSVVSLDEDEELTLKPVSDIAFVPTTVIGAEPGGGGTAFEPVNLLTPKRINSFAGTADAEDYYLDSTDIDDVLKVLVNGEEKTEGTDYTVDKAAGKVAFTTAPGVAPGGSGIDNVVITFAKTVDGYADRINKCRFFAFYGYNNDNRIFVSGNPDNKNYDWQSGLDDPTYFPDLGYTAIGADTSAIVGYLKQYENLVVVKEDNEQDAEIFLRTSAMDSDGKPYFPIKQGAKGVGAISSYAFATLRDDPLFLSRNGVMALASASVTQQRAVQVRSARINKKLTEEAGLAEAVAVTWNHYYILCVDSRCYVADARQISASGESFDYEWYYWQNVPARVFLEHDGDLFFGTADGRLCRFNTDIDTMSRFSDDGEPILARWSTKADSFGTFMRRKTMVKRGSGVMIKPYTRSSVTVYVMTEEDIENEIRYSTMDILDFNDIDFARFTFNTAETPQVVPFNKKLKKFITLRLIFENNNADEGFGIYGATVQFTYANYVK